MEVKLVSITKPVAEYTPKELIVYIARVSNPSNQGNMETAPKLIRYLINNKHWSPFEMVDLTVEIKTRRSIAQQILRHRSFSFQEFSQRYSTVFEYEMPEFRKQGATNRQSSEEVFQPSIEIGGSKEGPISVPAWPFVKDHIEKGFRLYDALIDAGASKETARDVLPLCTATTIYMKGSIRSWIHYLQIRCDAHTQKEHRLVANEILKIFKENFPNISEALNNFA